MSTKVPTWPSVSVVVVGGESMLVPPMLTVTPPSPRSPSVTRPEMLPTWSNSEALTSARLCPASRFTTCRVVPLPGLEKVSTYVAGVVRSPSTKDPT